VSRSQILLELLQKYATLDSFCYLGCATLKVRRGFRYIQTTDHRIYIRDVGQTSQYDLQFLNLSSKRITQIRPLPIKYIGSSSIYPLIHCRRISSMSRPHRSTADPHGTERYGTDPSRPERHGTQVAHRTRSGAHEGSESQRGTLEPRSKESRGSLLLDRDNVRFGKDVGRNTDEVSKEAMKYIVAQLPLPEQCDTAVTAKIRQVFLSSTKCLSCNS
jgi:hypothetical protein